MQLKALLPKQMLLLCLLVSSLVQLVYAEPNHAKQAVVIALNDWASQRVLSQVTGQLFEQLEVPYQYQQVAVADQWGAFRLGLVDIQVELWQGTSIDIYNKNIDQGYIIDVGTHAVDAREEWWYPSYVKPLCPGLPNWRALLNCEAIFAEPDSAGKGVYYSGHWNPSEGTRIRALGLNFSIKRLANDTALWGKLRQAVDTKQPIIMLNWDPNWTKNRISGEFVEFPPFNKKCLTQASWGVNKQLTNDCANPKSGWVKKISSLKFKNQYHCGYRALRRVTFTTEMIAEAAALVINDNLSESQAAQRWIEIYKPQWRSWLPQQCKPKED